MTTFTEDYEAPLEELPEDELTPEFVRSLIDRCMEFMEVFVGHPLHPYQTPFARRIIESVLINDGEELSAQASRQSGKSEVVADTVVTLMVLLPRLSKMYPDLLGRFSNGIWIGLFAPVEGQVETLFSRVMTRLTSERAQEIMGDPEIDDEASKAGGVVRTIRLKKSGSLVSMMTANPKAKIESRTFHLIILDEAQGSADQIVAKSLGPMLAYNAGTLVKTGTPATQKNNFYQTIQRNKRRQTGRGVKQNHFEWDWREVAKVNPNYGKFVKKEMLRIGEDSDEFQMSYCTVPETRILTADMRHIPAGDITVGMKLVGFDEERPGKGQHRRLQESVVEDVGRIMRPCYRLTLSDGTSITCSAEHRWLVTTAGRRTEWKMAKDLASTDRIFKVTDVWEHTEDYRTGYLAAAFEGEGHFSRHSMLGFSQRDNTMLLKVRKYLEELGFSTWEVDGSGSNKDVTVLHVGGGRSEVMRFLGQVRPERLLDKVDVGQFGTIGRHYKEPDQFQHPYVLNSEFVGEQEVVAIKTSTKTYIAEGLASHNCVRWILERGMFVTEGVMEQLSDRSMEVVKHWHKSPVVVGIDPARKLDSTVVTVVWVDWDRPDEFGYYDHRVLNWLELTGEDWEQQYAEITDFLANYDVLAVAVDANGVGDAVAQRLKLLLPRAEVIPVTSSMSEQSSRFKHLQALIQRKMIGFPGHSKARRLRTWKRFMQQMIDAERHYQGANFTVKAPEEAWAHDDHVDALALAVSCTKELVMPTIEVSASPFFG
jgi:hypothetical protein